MSVELFKMEITLTERYFVKGESFIRFSYRMHDKNEQLVLATPMEAALFFKKHKVIDTYTVKGEQVTMYKNKLSTVTGPKGEPIQYMKPEVLPWSDIDFSEQDVIALVANNEYDKTLKQMTPVVRMYNTIIERVA